MLRPIKNPDRLAGTNQGLKLTGTLSETSKAIITRFPISRKPHNSKKLIEIDGQWFRASELGQYYKNIADQTRAALPPVNKCLDPKHGTRRLIAEPETTVAFPSLSLLRNNCTETPPKPVQKPTFKALKGLNSHHKKSKVALLENVAYMVQLHGIENIGFLTLTFKQHIVSATEAQRRFKSLANHVLSERYPAYIRVIERQKSGRIHYHLLVAMNHDIRTGFDFDAISNHDYTSANEHLRLEWAYWRKSAPLYGFGRTELLPIKSSGRGLGLYVGKYIGKHIEQRIEADKGVRLVSYGGQSRNWNCKFTPLDFPSTQWRWKVETFARQIRKSKNKLCHGIGDLTRIMGKQWAFQHREYIMSLPPTDPSIPF